MPITLVKCKQCNQPFDSGGNPLRIYCNPRCRTKANRLKEKLKYQAAIPQAVKMNLSIVYNHNPTEELLNAYAAMGQKGELTQPVFFTGEIPAGWQAPMGVEFHYFESDGLAPNRWGMM